MFNYFRKKRNLEILNGGTSSLWKRYVRERGVKPTAKACGVSVTCMYDYVRGKRPVHDAVKLKLIDMSDGLFGIRDFY